MPFKFCPECGVATEPGARFCTGCGQPLAGGRGGSPAPLAGLVSLAVLLVLGGGFWLYFRLAPETPRSLKPGEGRTAAASAPSDGAAGGPAAHPQMELPDDIKQTIAKLAQDAESKPKDVTAWQTVARVYYRASRFDPSYAVRAEQAYHHLLELDPKNLDALRGLANIAYDNQDRAKAVEYYGKYLELSPDDPEVRTDMGTMEFENGDATAAIAEYNRVLAKTPGFFQAHFNLGVVFDAQGDRQKARAELEKARDLATDPGVKQRISALLDAATDGKSFAQAAEQIAAQNPPAAGPGEALAGGMGAGGAPGAGAAPPAGGMGAGASTAAAAAPASDFPSSVEQVFRSHPIAGPKIVRIDWPSPDRGQVVLSNFPMDAMPLAMRQSYLDKMQKAIGDARTRFNVGSPVTVELIDQASGKVMASVQG